jgi:hypothetical protein
MNKIDSLSTSVTLPTSPASDLEPASWLIVIIPSIEADLSAATRRVWELASEGSKRVRFIGLYENATQELILRRQLTGISAMINSAGIYTETEYIFGSDWVAAIVSHSQAGDMVACLANHRIERSNRTLSEMLQANINLPIYILSSSYIRKGANPNWKSMILFWSFSIATLSGFFLLQARINQVTSGGLETAFMLTSAALTLFILWVWNNLFS